MIVLLHVLDELSLKRGTVVPQIYRRQDGVPRHVSRIMVPTLDDGHPRIGIKRQDASVCYTIQRDRWERLPWVRSPARKLTIPGTITLPIGILRKAAGPAQYQVGKRMKNVVPSHSVDVKPTTPPR